MPDRPTRPTRRTRDAETRDERAEHVADRAPDDDEERLADDLDLDPDVAEHERDMTERGARQQGEGRLP
jgi:hypothetical protein